MQSFAKIHEEDCMFKVVVPLQMVMMYFAFEPRALNFCSCRRRLIKLQLQPGIKEDATVKSQVA